MFLSYVFPILFDLFSGWNLDLRINLKDFHDNSMAIVKVDGDVRESHAENHVE